MSLQEGTGRGSRANVLILSYEVSVSGFPGCRFHPPQRNQALNMKRPWMNMCVVFLEFCACALDTDIVA